MFKMKTTEPAFSTTDFSLDLDNGAVKSIILRHEDMNVVIIGNFDVVTQTATVTFPSTGTWYDYFEGTEVQIASAEQSIELRPGKYKMYTTKKFDKPNLDEYISTAIREVTTGHGTTAEKIKVYPMPATDYTNIQYSIPESGPVTVDIFSMQGEKVESIKFDHQLKGSHTVRWDISGGTPKGLYLVRISAGKQMMSAKIVVL
jgi:hypothetical protein